MYICNDFKSEPQKISETIMKLYTRAELRKELVNAGIRPSVQRLAIYEYVRNNRTHPTAENVYESLRDELGSLSLTTVYNTLKLYAEAGLVMTLHIDDGFLRFDGNTMVHAHFRCDNCGQIYDLPVKDDYHAWFEGTEELFVTDAQLYLRGLCRKCRMEN